MFQISSSVNTYINCKNCGDIHTFNEQKTDKDQALAMLSNDTFFRCERIRTRDSDCIASGLCAGVCVCREACIPQKNYNVIDYFVFSIDLVLLLINKLQTPKKCHPSRLCALLYSSYLEIFARSTLALQRAMHPSTIANVTDSTRTACSVKRSMTVSSEVSRNT